MTSEWDEKAQDEARAQYEAGFQELVDSADTAEERALEIASELEEMWLMLAPGKTADDFDAEIHEPFNHDCSVEELEEEYSNLTESVRELTSWPPIELALRIAYGHVYSARLSVACKANDLAWNSIEQAAFWQGVCVTSARLGARMSDKPSISDVARAAAHARNSENRAIKATAFEWLTEHYDECNSKDDAAERLTKIVPVVFRTARRYVSQWHLSRH